MIISLSGKKRVGKDVSANYLVSKFGLTKVAFADPVKKFASQALSIPIEYFYDDKLKDKPFQVSIQLYSSEIVDIIEDLARLEGKDLDSITWKEIPVVKNIPNPRTALQFIGTDLGRRFINDNIWINQLVLPENAIITDSRMTNEREFLKKNGAKTVLILRKTGESDNHESENELGNPEDYDYVITNNGTLEELYKQLDEING